jgi:putative SOS response-associated peptidase YedK
MCGRFALYSSGETIAAAFDLSEVPELLPHYNIAPSQPVAVIRTSPNGRELALLKWGLVPAWAKDKKLAPINAKAETAADKPMFRTAFRQRRCLIPADGYYEWQARGTKKQPYFFGPKDGLPFAFAGLWESREGDGEKLETCALLTTQANELAAEVHDRMPVILPPAAYGRWLDPDNQDVAALQALLRPYSAQGWFARPVSTLVNNPRNDDPRCIQGVGA